MEDLTPPTEKIPDIGALVYHKDAPGEMRLVYASLLKTDGTWSVFIGPRDVQKDVLRGFNPNLYPYADGVFKDVVAVPLTDVVQKVMNLGVVDTPKGQA